MNTGKQVNAMVLILFLTLIAVGAYTIWDPFRSDAAEDEQLTIAAERGATTFALNCRLCHGDRGEGGVLGGRLPSAPALDRDGLRGEAGFSLVANSITCGRVGTSMPTWGESQGGTLSDEQIRQLTVLITEGDWELALEHAEELDATSTGHATVQMPRGSFAIDETELIVSNAAAFALGQYIRISEERMRVLPNQLLVQRAVGGTTAAEHGNGTPFFRVGPGGQTSQVVLRTGSRTEIALTLSESISVDDTELAVSTTKEFAIGDTLQLGEEQVRVVGFAAGLPTTGQLLAEEIGRTPKTFMVSGAEGIEIGAIIRMEGELMEVTGIRDDGDPEITLDADASASAGRISVSDPVFFATGYVVRLGDELVEVIGSVETGQTLGVTVGRAETAIAVSGTSGIDDGMVIRMGNELLRVTDLQPAQIELERGADETQPASHNAGAALLKVLTEADQTQGVDPETGQTLLESLGPDGGSITVSGTSGITEGATYQIGSEHMIVTDVRQAQLRVQRGVEGTSRAAHPRRVPILEGNLLEVERGVAGTEPAAHAVDDGVFLTELDVKRALLGSGREGHSKNASIYLGHRLIVKRGVLDTEPADHENGALILNFPPPPTDPAINIGEACGLAIAAGGPTGPTPTPVPGAQDVAVSLAEWTVTAEPATIVDGPVTFTVSNDGAAIHNFRVVATDLASGDLPLAGDVVDEGQVEVIGGFAAGLRAGDRETAAAELPPGSYVLICNVPTHYGLGMHVAFEVTAP